MAEEKNFADMDLKDFIWETEEHRFEPKENRYENIVKGKKKEAEEKNKLKRRNYVMILTLADSKRKNWKSRIMLISPNICEISFCILY